MILYYIKDEETEDKFIINIYNIICIEHKEYDSSQKNLSNKVSDGKNYLYYNSKYEKDSMTFGFRIFCKLLL